MLGKHWLWGDNLEFWTSYTWCPASTNTTKQRHPKFEYRLKISNENAPTFSPVKSLSIDRDPPNLPEFNVCWCVANWTTGAVLTSSCIGHLQTAVQRAHWLLTRVVKCMPIIVTEYQEKDWFLEWCQFLGSNTRGAPRTSEYTLIRGGVLDIHIGGWSSLFWTKTASWPDTVANHDQSSMGPDGHSR